MPLKNGRLTARERAFAGQMARVDDPGFAAYRAGYGSPDKRGRELMEKGAVRAEVVRRHTDMLFNELLPLAVEAHRKLLTEAAVPAGARAQAVKLAYDRTIGASEAADQDKDPSEMTLDEIVKQIDRLQTERGDRAVDVTPAKAEPSVFD